MSNDNHTILQTLHMPTGFEFDTAEAYAKLITSQFGGHPARGAAELVQNAVDSYDPDIPLRKRHVELRVTHDRFSVRDAGEGLGMDRLKLLVTLGGTDKSNDPRKLGTFGMGFFSVLNPKLGTRRVEVVTRHDDHALRLSFEIDPEQPLALPEIKTEVLADSRKITGTEVTVEFNNRDAAARCLREAKSFLRYLPCRVSLNGTPWTDNVWSEAEHPDALLINDGPCEGFLRRDGFSNSVTILCKYERVVMASLEGLSTGGHRMEHDFRDLGRRGLPLVPPVRIVINHNGLSVTVSRDSVMMNSAYDRVVSAVAQSLFQLLAGLIENPRHADLIPANQYLFGGRIRSELEDPCKVGGESVTDEVIRLLVDAPIYRLSSRKERVSLRDIHALCSADRPVFYSPGGTNLRWLGGAFEHDFIVLPPECSHFGRTPEFYDVMFRSVFGDCVNLETIQGQSERIKDLVEKGIVDPKLLSPKCDFLGRRDATEDEQKFMGEIDALIADPSVRQTILNTLHLPASDIRAVLFDLSDEGVTVATGLFDDQGAAFDNAGFEPEPGNAPAAGRRKLRLGLMRSHPVIERLIASKDEHRAYYALTFLAHELVSCQRMLSPCSLFRNWVLGELSRNLRRVLVAQLLESKRGQDQLQLE